jgi:hypothetical protein
MTTMLDKSDLTKLEITIVQERLKDIVRESIEDLLDKDLDLIAIGGHEQAIFHRLAVYLERRTPELHVDCEYNRREADCKYMGDDKLIRPDVLVHERISQRFNALAVEGKANANPDTPSDMRKLCALTQQQGSFDYRLGVFIRIHNAIADLDSTGILALDVTWVMGNSTSPEVIPEDKPITRKLNSRMHDFVRSRHR